MKRKIALAAAAAVATLALATAAPASADTSVAGWNYAFHGPRKTVTHDGCTRKVTTTYQLISNRWWIPIQRTVRYHAPRKSCLWSQFIGGRVS